MPKNTRCRCFEYLILRPTLRLLEVESDAAVMLLLGTGLAETGLGSPDRGKYGTFAITSAQHRAVWDDYLAFDPERASLTRSLASPVAFLTNPDAELNVNPAYATAIAWLMYEASNTTLPAADQYHALARLWFEIYHPHEVPADPCADQYWHTLIHDAACWAGNAYP
jgi:hypothetical protein